MNILAINTAFDYLGICIVSDDILLANYYSKCKKRSSKIIFQVLDELFQNLKMAIQQVDLIVTATGPGSYTGVRIGMTAAKTLAMVNHKPLIGINSLQVLASLMSSPACDAFLNCHAKEVFHAHFIRDNGQLTQQTDIGLTNMDAVSESEEYPAIFYSISTNSLTIKNPPVSAMLQYPAPDAYMLSLLGKQQYEISGAPPLSSIQPLYIKQDA
ncbi:MAG: tRNA (adenosine(37)-N6)-threonylcarbamoyltransferase complex dimerization subunit type 1 TsaB [SAR324 cluster bacterium]|nr:tRNA (adenosine(37)-N6)-threonylcarbamoyltransferase complex dimerization subunit type 1 TsaB [SAR324 cluster bacterium]